MTVQLPLLEWQPPMVPIHMEGETYDVCRDFFRLNKLLARVRNVMLGQGWMSIEEVKQRVGSNRSGKLYGDASLRARHNNFRNHPALRDHFIAESRCEKGGLWLYRLSARGP